MTITDIIRQRQGKPFASFEIVPPLKGTDVQKLYDSLDALMQLEPPFINITCHRDEVEYQPNDDGTYTKRLITRRPSTIAIVAAVMRRYPQVEVVPHIICGGASRHQIENELLDLRFLGISNVMALRGDALPGQKAFIAEADGYTHTNQLVEAINRLAKSGGLGNSSFSGLGPNDQTTKQPNDQKSGGLGNSSFSGLGPNDQTTKQPNDQARGAFCVGVAAYPEKHFEAPNLDADIQNLKRKVEAGAHYIVTQMFFDNDVFYRFVEACQRAGIAVPIIPGLKPVTTLRQPDTLPRTFHIDLPQPLMQRLQHCLSNEEAFAVGTEWCIRQSEDLLRHGVPAIHYYTMGRAENIQQIVRTAFPGER